MATPLGKKMFEQAGGEGSKLAALHLGHTLCMHAQILEELGRYKEGVGHLLSRPYTPTACCF